MEQEDVDTSKILYPELSLLRLLDFSGETIDWSKVRLPSKEDLCKELETRISQKINTDCIICIDKEEFPCHLIVLQSYSELIDNFESFKKFKIKSDKCSSSSFACIYNWMINSDPSYTFLTRENVFDIFTASKYLKIKGKSEQLENKVNRPVSFADLEEQCYAFIDNVKIFNEKTAFDLYLKASAKNNEEIKQLMLPRIQKFFLVLVSSEDWLNLNIDDVKMFLTSSYILVNNEMEVFASAVRWLKHNQEERWPYRHELLECIRFGNMPGWQLVDIKRNPDNPEYLELANDPQICKLIDDGLVCATLQQCSVKRVTRHNLHSTLLLNTSIPRNWTNANEIHHSYKDFLTYLDKYRRNQLLEWNMNKNKDYIFNEMEKPKSLPYSDSDQSSTEILFHRGSTAEKTESVQKLMFKYV